MVAGKALSLASRAGLNANCNARSVPAPGIPSARRVCDGSSTRRAQLRSRPAAAVVNASAGDEVERLRQENAALRSTLAARLEALDASKKEEFMQQHAELSARAVEAGVAIPLVGGAAVETAVVVEEEETAVVVEEEEPEEVVVAEEKVGQPAPLVMEDGGVAAVVEVESDNTLVFKFGSSADPPPAVGNRGSASSMAASGVPGSGKPKDEAVVFTFDAPGAAEVKPAAAAAAPSAPAPSAAAPAAAAAAAVAAKDSESPGSDSGSDVEAKITATASTARGRKPRTRSPASASPKKRAPAAPQKAAVDPLAAARAAATKEAESHDPAVALAEKMYWLYATVPATPVAGAQCTLYFNRAQTEALGSSPRIQLHARFNNWELEPAGGVPDRLDMAPAEGVAKQEGTEFWKATFAVPAAAYELNFIFSDAEGAFDNNAAQNYHLPVEGPMTKDKWIDTAAERAEAAFLARKEAERVAAEKAAAEREEAALAADAQRADDLVAELKNCYAGWQEGAATSAAQWRTSPACAVAGGKVTLMYNRLAGPIVGFEIPEDQRLVLKVGHNGWKDVQDVQLERAAPKAAVADDGEEEEWWHATLEVPRAAAVLDFVVQYYEHFDNNGGADYRVKVAKPPAAPATVEAWAEGMRKEVLAGVTAARRAAEAAAAAREAAREAARQAVRSKAEEVRRRMMRHVLFTEPSTPAAGKEVTISYNPANTVLNGAERVFLRGGYNRWRHPKGVGPIEMTPPAAGAQHFSASVAVPKDAYSVDFVFSDAQEGGRFDNNSGLDYQLPVEGSVVSEPPLYVVHVAAEMAPIAKVGGLGDVVTALGRAVQEAGHQVEVILPRYDFFLSSPLLGGTQYETEFEWEGTRVFVSSCIVEGLRCWFIEPGNGLFATSTVYQGASDAARFNFFSRAALEFLLRTQRQPDILHCHDWSTAEVAKSYWTEYHSYGLWRPKVVFTIHNLNYGAAAIGDAAYFSQRFTTVSPTYAWEIAGNPAVAPNNAKLMGIRNGIDTDIWNPETDAFLPVGYTADTAEAGKAAAREELRRRVGLSGWGDKPLVGVVTRLTKQKGTHLIAHSAFRTLDRGGQFVLLGSAPDPKVQAEFNALAAQYGGDNAAFCFAFDEPLSHLIYAACDIILVPSMFEPCGLTQMIAMRYGAVPVVRATGGLKDTVFDVDNDKARAAWELEGSTDWQADGVDATNGFNFDGTDEGALDYALNRAMDAWYNDRAWFRSLQQRVMRQDWSWNKPAIDYIQLYYAAMK